LQNHENALSACNSGKKRGSIEGTTLITLEAHFDNMEIWDAAEDKEHRYTDDGEEIVCPVCGAVWLQEVEGEYTFGTCEHLRFSLHSECP